MIDPHKLRPGELCRLSNSTPLSEVINQRQLKRQREQAALRIADGRHVDLIRYVAWLVQVRHMAKSQSEKAPAPAAPLGETAEGAAALGSRCKQMAGHGQKLTRKQECLIAALFTEPNHRAAAAKAGVGPRTLYRWLHLPDFRAAYRQARREILEFTMGRIQAHTGVAVETLLEVAQNGRRDSGRVRAATALLEYALRGLIAADTLHGEQPTEKTSPMDTGEVAQLLAVRLRQLDEAELPTGEKARLIARLSDVLLGALEVNLLDKRQEALQAVLLDRKEQGR